MTKAVDTIICDDIRQEINGKLFLIGVYTDGIQINSTSKNLLVSFWLRFSGFEEGPYPHSVEVRMNGKITRTMSGTTQIKEDGSGNGFAVGIMLELTDVGLLSFRVVPENGEPIDAGEVQVTWQPPQEGDEADP